MKKSILFLSIFIIVHFTLYINNCSAQWVQVSNGMGENAIFSFTIKDNYIFAGANNGVFLSTNYGGNWTQTGLTSVTLGLALLGSNIFAAGYDWMGNQRVYLSTNNGSNWILKYSLYTSFINCLAATGQYIFLGSGNWEWPGELVYSTDNGDSWYPTLNRDVNSLGVNGSIVLAGSDNGVWRSTNYGANWSLSGLAIYETYSAFAISGTNVFVGTVSNGVYHSTNNGINWNQTTLNNRFVSSLVISGSNIFAGTYQYGVYLSTNNGSTWVQKNEGFNVISTVKSLLIANGYIFAGTNGQSVWRRPLTELITGIQPVNNNIPDKYYLYQNYPNPFNPSTKIRYEIPNVPISIGQADGIVTLKVYDMLGKEVAVLVNEKLQPGTYEVIFDSGDLPSGVYFYRLKTNNFSATKKLILLK